MGILRLLPVPEPFGPLGLVVDVLDLVHWHGVRSVDGHRYFLLDVHRVRLVDRVWHGFFHRVSDRLDDRHRVRHAHGNRLRYAHRDRPVHWHGYGAVDLNVLRDHVFGSVWRGVSRSVSEKSVELKKIWIALINNYGGLWGEYRSVFINNSTCKFVVRFERCFFKIFYYFYSLFFYDFSHCLSR